MHVCAHAHIQILKPQINRLQHMTNIKKELEVLEVQ